MFHCCAMTKRTSLEDFCHFNPCLLLKVSLLDHGRTTMAVDYYHGLLDYLVH